MKKILLTLSCCFAALHLFAQKIEITGGVHTGLMHFAGKSANATSFINGATENGGSSAGSPYAGGYTNNPYGTKTGTGFGGDIQAQLVYKSFIIGLQGGYESLKSKLDINGGNAFTPGGTVDLPLSGSAELKGNYININPYIGYRLPVPVVKIDLLAGFDLAHATSFKEKASAKDTQQGTTYTTNVDRKNDRDGKSDKRLRFGIAARYHRVGITANYSHGLTNYLEGMIGGTGMEAHTEVLRFGLSYQVF